MFSSPCTKELLTYLLPTYIFYYLLFHNSVHTVLYLHTYSPSSIHTLIPPYIFSYTSMHTLIYLHTYSSIPISSIPTLLQSVNLFSFQLFQSTHSLNLNPFVPVSVKWSLVNRLTLNWCGRQFGRSRSNNDNFNSRQFTLSQSGYLQNWININLASGWTRKLFHTAHQCYLNPIGYPSLYFWFVSFQTQFKLWYKWGRGGGGQTVSMLAFYSEDMGSNSAYIGQENHQETWDGHLINSSKNKYLYFPFNIQPRIQTHDIFWLTFIDCEICHWLCCDWKRCHHAIVPHSDWPLLNLIFILFIIDK